MYVHHKWGYGERKNFDVGRMEGRNLGKGVQAVSHIFVWGCLYLGGSHGRREGAGQKNCNNNKDDDDDAWHILCTWDACRLESWSNVEAALDMFTQINVTRWDGNIIKLSLLLGKQLKPTFRWAFDQFWNAKWQWTHEIIARRSIPIPNFNQESTIFVFRFQINNYSFVPFWIEITLRVQSWNRGRKKMDKGRPKKWETWKYHDDEDDKLERKRRPQASHPVNNTPIHHIVS